MYNSNVESTSKKLIAKKLVNALISDAAGKVDVFATLAWFSKQMGGLWVGGSLFLFEDSLHFEANSLNQKLQTGNLNVEIPLISIERVSPRFGFFTGIIDVVWTKESKQYVNSFRCYGSQAFLTKIQSAIESAKKQAPAPINSVGAP